MIQNTYIFLPSACNEVARLQYDGKYQCYRLSLGTFDMD